MLYLVRPIYFLRMRFILLFSVFIISTISLAQDHSMDNMPGMNNKQEQKKPEKQKSKKVNKSVPHHHHAVTPHKNNDIKKDSTKMEDGMDMDGMDMHMEQKWHDSSMNATLTKTVPPTGDTIVYHLYINDTIVNYTGKEIKAIAINGKLPGPTLHFTEGDYAEIWVHNKMHMEASIHWHGLLVPNLMDGVPYLTTPPIEAGEYFVYRFLVKQTGTYWYHSHTMLEEQIGLYGSIVIHPQQEKYKVKDDIVLLLSEWTNQKPEKILKNLKRRNEYYSIKKGYAQSLDQLIKHKAVWDRLKASARRMPPMDISDVYYHRFLANGQPETNLTQYQPGDIIRVRVIDAGASSSFYLQFAGGKMKMIAADGQEIEPIMVDRVLIASAETYDFLITVPSDGSFEFRATVQDVSGYSSTFFGKGNKVLAPDIPRPNVWKMMGGMSMGSMNMDMNKGGMDNMNMNQNPINEGMKNDSMGMRDMNMNGTNMPGMDKMEKDTMSMKDGEMENMNMGENKDHNAMKKDSMNMGEMDMGNMEMGSGMDMREKDTMNMSDMSNYIGPDMMNMKGENGMVIFNYNMLRAPQSTVLPKDMPVREITLVLTGNMYRYVWSINNKVLSDADKILIEKGEVVRIHLENQTMMSHPMHLHGHFFRVINKNGDYSPLKHTVNVPPFTKITLEFEANEEKEWFFHCHILYHMMSGMSRIFSYKYSTRDPLLDPYPLKKLLREDREWYFWSDLAIKSQMTELRAVYSNTKNAFRTESDANYSGQFEIEASYERYVTNYFRPYVGITNIREKYFNVLTNEQIFAQQFNLPVVGIRYTLPFFIESDLRVNAKGRFRLELDWELWILPRLFTLYRANTDREYHIDAQYIISRDFSLSAGYDSRYKWGGGIVWRF